MEYVNYVAEILGWTAFHSIWQIAAICILLKVTSFFMPTEAYKSKLALLGSAAFLIALSSITTFIYLFDASTLSSTPIEQMPVHYFMYQPTLDPVDQSGFFHWIEEHSQWMGMLWLLGSLVLFMYWGSGYFYLKKLQRNATIIEGKWKHRISEWSQNAGRNSNLKIALSSRVMSPVLTGIVQPVILFPAGMWQAFDETQIECILRHEWLHWKRYDHLINIAVILFESIYFFHPLSWWLGKEIRHLQELIVDRETVTHTQQPIQYAKTLYEVQQLALKPNLGMTAFAAGKGKLLHRIERILTPNQGPKTSIMNTQSIGIIAATLLLALLGSIGAYSMKVSPTQTEDLPLKQDMTFEEPYLNDTIPPEEEEIEVDDFTIQLDEKGEVKSVKKKPNTIEKRVIIKKRGGKVEKEIEVQKIGSSKEKVKFETSTTTITNEDGTTETIPQLIIRKPKSEKVEEIKIIKRDGKQSFKVLRAPNESYFHLSAPEVERIRISPKYRKQKVHFVPSNEVQYYFNNDTMPSPEEWEEFEQKMQEYSQRMAEWGKEYAEKMKEIMLNAEVYNKIRLDSTLDEEKLRKIEQEIEKRAQELDEKYSERIQKWSEKFEIQMGEMGKKMELHLDSMRIPPPPPPPSPPPLPEQPDIPSPPSSPDDQ